MNHSPIFILTWGRTGSTWLQRLLNLHPRITIWGEHYGFLNGVARAYWNFHDEHDLAKVAYWESADGAPAVEVIDDPRENPGWLIPFSPGEVVTSFRDFIWYLFARKLAPEVRWGFKEIRYGDPAVPRMLACVFPEARFLLLERDVAECLRSMVLAWKSTAWRELREAEIIDYLRFHHQRIQTQKQTFEQLHELFPGQVRSVHYRDLERSLDSELAHIFDFLGEDLGMVDPAKIDAGRRRKTDPTDRGDRLLRKTVHRILARLEAESPV
jgi:hypothetical protein